MSYTEAMKWRRKHPKGTKQPILMSTGSGFWPAGAWLKENYWPYVAACKQAGIEPFGDERFYRATSGTAHYQRTSSDYAAMTKAGTL